MKTKVIHLQMNPTSIAKQQRSEEVEQLRVECQRLRERLRKIEASGGMTTDDTTLIIPPSQEILGKYLFLHKHYSIWVMKHPLYLCAMALLIFFFFF